MGELTTTSYAILSLLAVQPWSTYELARQMDRSVHWFWPTAESVVYEEPKKLVRMGLAVSRREYTGRRPRTVYEISAEGRRELRRWLDEPRPGPQLQFEAMIQVAFADQGTKEQLLRTLRSVGDDAEARRDEGRSRVREYQASGGPFPERLPVIAVTGKFLYEFAELVARWAQWAEREVEEWDGVAGDEASVPPGAWVPGFPDGRPRAEPK